ncbi:hypothetical protein DY000_02058150, partial [Brassica cretica]
ELGDDVDAWLTENLTNQFSSLSSPDDLLNFFTDMRGILGSLDSGAVQDDRIVLDHNSNLGMFVRRCILAFNLLSFEGVCHLFSSIEAYCREAHSSSAQYDASNSNLESLTQYDQMDMEIYVMDKATKEMELHRNASGSVSFHLHTPEALFKVTEGIPYYSPIYAQEEFLRISGLLVSRKEKSSTSKFAEATSVASASSSKVEDTRVDESLFLRTNLQIQGFLMEKADAIEASFYSLIFLHLIYAIAMMQVHFLRYLNKLHSDDYFAALDNLLRYFDYSAGTEGFDLVPPSTGCSMHGRYEIGLLCLGMMHFRFGHPNLALEPFLLVKSIRGNLKLAQRICNELGGLASTTIGVDMELKVEASLREARTLLAAKQYSQMAGNAVMGLPYALASISFCQSFNLDLLKASATLTLAELWRGLGSNHSKRALDLLHGAFPMILGHGGLELRARAYIFEANCYLSDPSFSVSTDSDTVWDSLRQASDELQALEYHELTAEALYLMAMVYDKLGRPEEREEAAALFKKHITALEIPQDVEPNMA